MAYDPNDAETKAAIKIATIADFDIDFFETHLFVLFSSMAHVPAHHFFCKETN